MQCSDIEMIVITSIKSLDCEESNYIFDSIFIDVEFVILAHFAIFDRMLISSFHVRDNCVDLFIKEIV